MGSVSYSVVSGTSVNGVEGHGRGAVGGFYGVGTMFGGASSGFSGRKKPRRGFRRGCILRSQGVLESPSARNPTKIYKKSHAVPAFTCDFYSISAENGGNRRGNAPFVMRYDGFLFRPIAHFAG